METEPILDKKNARVQLYPIIYKDIWEFYELSKASFWIPEEIKMNDDKKDWVKLDDNERHFIKYVLAFFAGSDFIVNEHLDTGFCEEVSVPELRFFYHFQEMMEDIHSDTYVRLIQLYVDDEEERKKLFKAVTDFPCIRKKAEWAKKWIANGTFVERLVAFTIIEGVFFSGSFCAIYWLKKRGLMPGLTFSNDLISRDEGMHRDLGCLVYRKYIKNKLDESKILEMVKEAVEIEEEFVRDSLPVALIGINSDLMIQHIKHVANHLLNELIGKVYYSDKNPFTWMTLFSLQSKTNFFERRVSEYAVQQAITPEKEKEIDFDAPF